MNEIYRVTFLVLCLISGGFYYYESITVGIGLISQFFALPCFVICSLIVICIPAKSKIKFLPRFLNGLLFWLPSISILFLILKFSVVIRDLSPILVSAKYYWEEGVDVEFRKDRTYKAFNNHMIGGIITYGHYELNDSLIIIKDSLKFGMEKMNDTLLVSNKGISFRMEKPWRISEGVMSFEYLPTTNVHVANNTNTVVDSFFIKPYTKESISLVSIEPLQYVNYKFDMKNPYVNGEYQLSYRINGQAHQHSNILKGYPLETVESIKFEEDSLVINLIFGKTIPIRYK